MDEQETARDERAASRGQVEQAPRPRDEVATGASKPIGEAPILKVINPDATPEEIAALVAVFSALGSMSEDRPKRPRPAWSHPARSVRSAHRHGEGAWRASGLPR